MAEDGAALIDAYIEAASPAAQPVLRKIRSIIRKAAPGADEIISYRMPAFRGHGVLLYFAAFKKHIGVFPPVSGDAKLEKELERYRGPKGNLQFPLDEPMPYALIARIAALRAAQDAQNAAAHKKRKRAS
ncbi:MAG: DUF1801 domain-containing protein [Caulobacterales bacterium]